MFPGKGVCQELPFGVSKGDRGAVDTIPGQRWRRGEKKQSFIDMDTQTDTLKDILLLPDLKSH